VKTNRARCRHGVSARHAFPACTTLLLHRPVDCLVQKEEERRQSLQKEPAAAQPKVLEVRRQPPGGGGPPRERGSRGGSRGGRGARWHCHPLSLPSFMLEMFDPFEILLHL
jgi:hypothetical protein